MYNLLARHFFFIPVKDRLEQQVAPIGAFLNTTNCRNKLCGYSVVVLCSFAQQKRVQHYIRMICPDLENAFYYKKDKKDRGKLLVPITVDFGLYMFTCHTILKLLHPSKQLTLMAKLRSLVLLILFTRGLIFKSA